MTQKIYDYIIIGSGFGGAVSAMRLSEKGYSVLILEKGKRFADEDFAKRNWAFRKYLWMPAIRAHGILQIRIMKGAMILFGAGVGGGSLGYANVLEVPSQATFATPAWNAPIRWGEALAPHYETAKQMLGVTRNPKLWKADETLREIAASRGTEASFRATEVGVFFGAEGETVPDPFFGGKGPARAGCIHCGGCMVGCRHNAKNTLLKNYLLFAEKNGVEIRAESEALDVKALLQAKRLYEVTYRRSTGRFGGGRHKVRARNVIFSAGVMGTMSLLLKLRDVTRSLPDLSPALGEQIRTNSEALLGSIGRKSDVDYSEGIAITSIFNADDVTRIEPVRYPDGSSLMRFVSAPLISQGDGILARLLKSLWWTLTHPLDFLKTMVLPGWAHNATILLVMPHVDNHMKFRIGRGFSTLFRRGLMAEPDNAGGISARVDAGHDVTRDFAARTNGIPMGSLGENLLNLPTTAHILGGAPIGADASTGVVDEYCQIHNYPGLYIVDGSIMPANPGVNPSLTITALAEYAMNKIAKKDA
ncbi:MAG: GMC family oxidoreductase [Anaerolineales bacterium]|nr:GMC family oxidoreductase [Anaerolineales bacterium]